MQTVPQVQGSLRSEASEQSARRYQALLQIAEAAAGCDVPGLIQEVAQRVVNVFPFTFLAHSVHIPSRNTMLVSRVSLSSQPPIPDVEVPINSGPSGWVWQNQKPLVLSDLNAEQRFSKVLDPLKSEGLRSLLVLPMTTSRSRVGAMHFGSTEVQQYDESALDFLLRIAGLVALAVENSRALGGNAAQREVLEERRPGIREQIARGIPTTGAIVGESTSLKRVLQRVQTVAPSNTSVLITGETGTGKELIAHQIHHFSSKSRGKFIHLNCAAIPTGLLESELFGHEKGAFTGASSQKIGRLELADQGTLFLDEVGEIPLELQPKLLRALQGQQFERLGGTKTITVNARIVAATNRSLEDAIAQQQFRSDLFYRLNVFPIHVPPLRERLEDMKALANYFIAKFAEKMGRRIDPVSEEVTAKLRAWHWPGNIRELENFIERSVLLSKGATLRPPFTELHQTPARKSAHVNTLEEVEREYILRTLRMVGGVVAGSKGAASRLGMKRTTLQSKIKRLGITPSEYGR